MNYRATTLAIFLLLLSACSGRTPTPNVMIMGIWEYTMIDQNGNIYDQGTVSFEGDFTNGQYTIRNFYNIEYSGEFKIEGNEISLSGAMNWVGQIENGLIMSGDWVDMENNASGTWTATRSM